MLHRFRQLIRLHIIYRILVRYGLDQIIPPHPLNKIMLPFLYLTPDYWGQDRQHPRGERIRMALETLGPIFVKFGQILSTRRDLLPEDISNGLARLQDNVSPFPAEKAVSILEQAYEKPLMEIFAEFEREPMAAASIAQVHRATLHTGEKVVVKIVRPGILPRIRNDLGILYLFAELAERYWKEGPRLRPREVVQEFEKNLYDELDLLREAGNCAILRRNFEDSDILYIPEVMWSYVRPNIMVMEQVFGVPVDDVKNLRKHHVDMRRLAHTGVEIFFAQVFRDNFFHADMHPGNVFIDISNPEYPSYVAVDFGIMGTLSSEDQHYLAENFLAFFRRDYRRVAELHVHSGWVPPGTRVEEFEGAIRCVCEPIFNRPIKEISFGMLLLRLFQTARRFNMEVQPQLVLLQKTLLNIEGVGRQLYPDLDLWETAKPFLERWMNERIGPLALLRGIRDNAHEWTDIIPKLPVLIYETLQETHAAQHENKKLAAEIRSLREDLRAQSQNRSGSLLGGALLISGALILALDTLYVLNLPMLGVILGGSGLFALLMSWR